MSRDYGRHHSTITTPAAPLRASSEAPAPPSAHVPGCASRNYGSNQQTPGGSQSSLWAPAWGTGLCRPPAHHRGTAPFPGALTTATRLRPENLQRRGSRRLKRSLSGGRQALRGPREAPSRRGSPGKRQPDSWTQANAGPRGRGGDSWGCTLHPPTDLQGPEALMAHAGGATASLATWIFSSPRTRPGSSLPGVTCSPFRCMNSRDSAAEGRAGLLPGLVRLPSPSREQMGILVHATNSSCQEQTRFCSEARTTVMNAQKHLHAGPGPLDPYLGLDGLVSEMNSGTTSN